MAMTLADSLAAKSRLDESTGCRLWTAFKQGGYGRLTFGGRLMRAHRASYEVANGPIPYGMEVCHKCDNPSCIAPDHLFLGKHADNMRDMREKGRANRMRGADNPRAKLSESDVLSIRASAERSIDLATKYGVSDAVIADVRHMKSWKHIGGANG